MGWEVRSSQGKGLSFGIDKDKGCPSAQSSGRLIDTKPWTHLGRKIWDLMHGRGRERGASLILTQSERHTLSCVCVLRSLEHDSPVGWRGHADANSLRAHHPLAESHVPPRRHPKTRLRRPACGGEGRPRRRCAGRSPPPPPPSNPLAHSARKPARAPWRTIPRGFSRAGMRRRAWATCRRREAVSEHVYIHVSVHAYIHVSVHAYIRARYTRIRARV